MRILIEKGRTIGPKGEVGAPGHPGIKGLCSAACLGAGVCSCGTGCISTAAPQDSGPRFPEGSIAMFQADLTKSDAFGSPGDRSGAVKAKIIQAHVGTKVDGKVLYDLALWDGENFYEAIPIREVDSCFVMPEAAEAPAQQESLSSSTGRPFNCRERYERNWTSK